METTDSPWRPSDWSLRTKIAVVLLLPVIVALALGSARIQVELEEAGGLSAVRDQLPVLRGTAELAELVGEEMVSAVSDGVDITARQAAVDAKAAEVGKAADFVGLASDTSRKLSAALGGLDGLRAAGASADPVIVTAGYQDILGTLGEVVPSLVAPADVSDLDASAISVQALLQLRSGLAVEEGLLRSSATGFLGTAVVVAAHRVAAEEVVLVEQLQRGLTGAAATSLAAATSSAASRRDAMASALTADRASGLRGLLPQINTESTAVDGLVDDLVGAISDDVTARTNQSRSAALRDASIVLGALLAALTIALLVARSLVSPIRRLHAAALSAARHQLPETIKRVHAGEGVDPRAIEPVPVRTRDEIGQLARAFDDMHRQAVLLAGEQAELRRQVSEMFMTLSRRSQSLVELQLSVIEGLEAEERDPGRLEVLFRLDHLATRLRRNGENLQVLAGGRTAQPDQGPVTMVELLRAATSEVEDYQRIGLGHAPSGWVRAEAAADVVHLLAELLENATRFSPPDRKVLLTADRGADGGLLVEVVDSGLGMAPADLQSANRQLAARDAAGPETTRRMGLFVVGRLAARHGVTVRLRPTFATRTQGGITASVYVPGELVVTEGVADFGTPVSTNGAATNGAAAATQVAVAAPPMPTPIFDQVASKWFTKPTADSGHDDWGSPADKGWQAAKDVADVPARTTEAGLPVREAGARLLPGAAPGQADRQPVSRDPEAIRNNLSRHYDGMRAARQRTQGEAEPTRQDGA